MNAKHLQLFSLVLLALVGLSSVDAKRGRNNLLHPENAEDAERQGKVLSLFQIVRFPNDPCPGNGSGKNGTCYTAEECASRSGVSSGSCAEGYGVCCTFSVNCGASSAENCTYFESTGSESGGCSVEICPCSNNICQLRLDFNQFTITGPSTSTISVGTQLAGQATNLAGSPYTSATQCLTDTFSVTNPGSQTPPTICGINTGQHMYVDVCGDMCNTLTFQLGQMGMGTGLVPRQWNIKVTQYSCDYNNLAPDGCTQYFFGNNAGSVESYNFAGGSHLANQDQNICIRRERGNCRICWTAAMVGDFMISGMTAMMGFISQSKCGGYGTDGMGTKGFEAVFVPGARNTMMTSKMGPDKFCGQTGLLTSMGMAPATVCSNRQPFNLRFVSDGFENDMESMNGMNGGFRLTYFQNNMNCQN